MKKPTAEEIAPFPMTVVQLKVDAYQRLTAAHVHPSPTGLVKVRGRNRQGKSSLIGSMLEALGIEKSELPIHGDEHGAEIELDLGQIVVRKTFTRDASGIAKPQLTVTVSDGSTIRSPAGVLKELRSKFADPVAFIESAPKEQVRTVLAVLGLDEELQRLEDEAAEIYEERRDLGREADRLGKAATEAEEETSMLPAVPPEGRLEEAVEELQLMNDRNAGRGTIQATIVHAEERGKELGDRVAELEAELEKAKVELGAQRERYKVARRDLKSAGDSENVAELADEIGFLRRGAEAKGKLDLAAQLRDQAIVAQAIHAEADERLELKRVEIGNLLAETEFPTPGMTYDFETKMLAINGIPFSQASQSEQIYAAASVAMAGDPKIRVMIAREGSLLDEESQAALAELAESRGFQLWLEVVDSNAEGAGIYIEDGQAFESDGGEA